MTITECDYEQQSKEKTYVSVSDVGVFCGLCITILIILMSNWTELNGPKIDIYCLLL